MFKHILLWELIQTLNQNSHTKKQQLNVLNEPHISYCFDAVNSITVFLRFQRKQDSQSQTTK